MRRSRGTRKLEHIRIADVGEADIFIDLNDGTFYSYLAANGDKVSEPTLAGIRERVRSELSARGHFNWIPAIRVETHDHDEGSGVSLDYDRFYLAKRPAGEWMKCDWDEKPEDRASACHTYRVYRYDRFQNLTITIPLHVNDGSSHMHLLPYSESMWTGLEMLNSKLSELQVRLDNLLNSTEGRKRVETAAGKLLSGLVKP